MPVILHEEQHDAWLLGEASKEILIPFPAPIQNPIKKSCSNSSSSRCRIIRHRASALVESS
jgi:hypothetical protein